MSEDTGGVYDGHYEWCPIRYVEDQPVQWNGWTKDRSAAVDSLHEARDVTVQPGWRLHRRHVLVGARHVTADDLAL